MQKTLVYIGIVILSIPNSIGQCDPNVPIFNVDLSNSSDSVWTSPNISRNGYCCDGSGNDKCIDFVVTLDENAAGISMDIISGAVPGGALFFQINCGDPIPMGDPICLQGAGPHIITFCKPGNNSNVYQISSIPAPIAGVDVSVNDGCSQTLNVTGFDAATVTWTSVYPGTQGEYDDYLSCSSGCLSSQVSATTGTPPEYIDYLVCGEPASACNNFVICDTVRVYFNPTLSVEISPIDPVICFGATSTTITANGLGGTPPYSYLWNNVNPSQSNIVGQGTYTVEMSDASGCPPTYATVTVTTFANPITANAGPDDTLCIQIPTVGLNGSIISAGGGVWSGGSGTFSPNDSSVTNLTYTPTSSELANGFVDLILTSTENGECPGDSDTVRVTYLGFTGTPVISTTDISCYGLSDGSATINVSGGIQPYTFDWNTVPVQTTPTISNLGLGNYSVTITDGLGCTIDEIAPINQPLPLNSLSFSVDVSCFGGSDGAITSLVSGGTSPYNYSWSPGGQTTGSIINVSADSYSYTITDANGCAYQGFDTILEPAQATIAIQSTNVNCFGGNDGTASTTITNPQGTYSYSWSPSGGNASVATGLSAGIYTVTATSSLGCVISNTVTISEPLAALSVVSSSTNVSCFGGNDGTASLSVSGGTAPYSYYWVLGGETTGTVNNLNAGSYTYQVTDANGCLSIGFVVINEPTELLSTVDQQAVSCFGGNNGIASVYPSGGNSPYSYLWTPGGQTTSTVFSLAAGTYSVTVTDNNGCSSQSSIDVQEPLVPLSAIITSSPTLCFGSNDGSLSSAVSGGTPPYSYFWLPTGESTTSTTGGSGSYSLKVTDANGCSLTEISSIVEPTSLSISFSTNAVNCYGGSDGAIVATVSGGTGNYSYSWSHSGETNASVTNLEAGTYKVTVQDDNGCIAADSVVVSEPNYPLSATTSSTMVSCNGGSDGMASVTAIGGTSPYTYLWGPDAEITSSISGKLAGTYSVLVSDINNCTYSTTATIEEPTPLTISSSATIDASCNGYSDGSISVIVSGGTLNYSYSWSPALGTSNVAGNLGAGAYTLTTTDQNGCTISQSYTIAQPDPITSTYSVTDVSCFGGNNGIINASASGGTVGYSYSWMPGNLSGASITGLEADTYTLMLQDANGCTYNEEVIVNEVDEIILSSGAINSDCGQANGLAYVEVLSGGTAPFTYLWNPGNIANDTAVGLFSGIYGVLVTDANGCIARDTGNVNDIASPLILMNHSNVSCNGGNDGTADVSLLGGISPFTYLWSNGATGAAINNLNAGTYSVVVGGFNGCNANAYVTITEPDPLSAFVSSTPVLCNGDNNGTAKVIAFGGTPGYLYNWSGSLNNNDSVFDLASGLQTIEITDNNGCVLNSDFSITEPAAITIITSVSDVTCFGGSDGYAISTATGGAIPYDFFWVIPNSNGPYTGGLSAGNYTVQLTDDNGCMASENVAIIEPPQLILTTSTTNSSCGLANGSATVNAVGGTPSYSYSWAPSGGVLATESNLIAGSYAVMVLDDNFCNTSAVVNVIDTPGPTTSIGLTTNVTCNGGSDGSAVVDVTGGTAPFSYLWSDGETSSTASALSIGYSTVTVTDFNGCTSTSLTPQITEPDPLVLNITTEPVSCFGGNDGGASVTAFGGTPSYTFQWLSTGSLGTSLSGLSSGIDSVQVIDNNGCETINTFNIEQPDELVIDSIIVSNVNCLGGEDGTATVYPSGGTQLYYFDWTPSGGNNNIGTGFSAGSYTVNLTDANGCNTAQITIVEEPVIALTATSNVTPSSCFGGTNGTATIIPSGGTPGYEYLWSVGGVSGATAVNLSKGIYTVTINDTNGCQTTASLEIEEPPAIFAEFTVLQPSCSIDNGELSVMVTGGTPGFSFLWSTNETSDNILNLAPQFYSVDITDSEGCLITVDTTLVNIPGPIASLLNNGDASCFQSNDGFAEISISSGTQPYSINWNPFGGDSNVASGFYAGIYFAIVTDSLNCTDTVEVTINEPELMEVSIDSIRDVTCFGSANGFMAPDIAGGTGNYSFLWSTGSTSLDSINNLTAGTYSVVVTDSKGCQDSIPFNINEPIDLTSVVDSIFSATCYGSQDGFAFVASNGGTAPYSYLWSNGVTGNSINNVLADNYSVTVTDANNCQTNIIVTIDQPDLILTEVLSDDSICFGQNGTLSAIATGGSGNFSFAWQPLSSINAGNLNDSPSYTTEYFVVAYDDQGCPGIKDTATIFVFNLTEDNIDAQAYAPICPGQSTVVYVQTYDVMDSITFSWDNGLGTGPGGFLVEPTEPTSYIVTATNFCGATIRDTVNVTFNSPPIISFGSDITSGCIPISVQFMDSSLSSNPIDPIVTWEWNFGDNNTSDSQNPIYEYSNAGDYNVTLVVYTLGGCTNSNSSNPYIINAYPIPVADFEVNSNNINIPMELLECANNSTGAISYYWDFGDGNTSEDENPIHPYDAVGDFDVQLIVINEYGCSDTTETVITTGTDIIFPTAFTPSINGGSGGFYDVTSLDNDVFFPYTAGVIDYKLQIFNRWGELIFESTDINIGWDGYYRGNLVKQDTYVWKAHVKLNTGKRFDKIGNVTLLR